MATSAVMAPVNSQKTWRASEWSMPRAYARNVTRLSRRPGSKGSLRRRGGQPGARLLDHLLLRLGETRRQVRIHLCAGARLHVGEVPVAFGKALEQRAVEHQTGAGLHRIDTVRLVDDAAPGDAPDAFALLDP